MLKAKIKDIASFYGECLKQALIHSLGFSDLCASIFGMLFPAIAKLSGASEATMNSLFWQVPLYAFAGFGLLRLLLSPYFVWKEASGRATRFEEALNNQINSEKIPDFKCTVEQFAIGDLEASDGTKPTLVIAKLQIINRGKPSIAHNFSMFLKKTDGELVLGIKYWNPVKDMYLCDDAANPQKIQTIRRDMHIEKICMNPIPEDGLVFGYLAVHFAGLSREIVSDGKNNLIIEFYDAKDRQFSCIHSMTERPHPMQGRWGVFPQEI